MQRRDFLKRGALAGAALPLAGGRLFARPLAPAFFSRPAALGDRVLVLINLNGGNDGLNTVVPVNDPAYHNARKTIALKVPDLVKVTDDLSLHGSMARFGELYGQGSCAVVENVGYPDQDRSHFRSTDIWHSASRADQVLYTGWLGRYLATSHPEYPATLPRAPFAIQVSPSTSLALESEVGGMGIAIDNPDRFYSLASGLKVDPEPLPATLAGPELAFVREVIEQSNFYSAEVNKAMLGGSTNAQYDGDPLSAQLRVVARLINGGLRTGIFVVALPGFDTHVAQLVPHAQRLQWVSRSVGNFLDDVAAAGNGDRVVAMTYSEFGRRLNENGSAGTDHGAAAPLFVLGRKVRGGRILGGAPNLTDLDDRGDVKFAVDFRQVYATILEDWMGFTAADTATALGGEFPKLDLFETAPSAAPSERDAERDGLAMAEPWPNPASGSATVAFTLPEQCHVRLRVVDMPGATRLTAIDRTVEAGSHRVTLDLKGLGSGSYVAMLEAGRRRILRALVVAR